MVQNTQSLGMRIFEYTLFVVKSPSPSEIRLIVVCAIVSTHYFAQSLQEMCGKLGLLCLGIYEEKDGPLKCLGL